MRGLQSRTPDPNNNLLPCKSVDSPIQFPVEEIEMPPEELPAIGRGLNIQATHGKRHNPKRLGEVRTLQVAEPEQAR